MQSALRLLLALSLCTVSACKKDEVDLLPEATTVGKNKMGCLVNGKAWKPYEAPRLVGGSTPYVVYWQVRNGRVGLTMLFDRDEQPGKEASNIYFYVPTMSGPGSYALDQVANPMFATANPAYGQYINTGATPDIAYLTGPTSSGQLQITRFDTTARIVSGTFDFTGRSAGGSTVDVSQGRFDMRLQRR